MMKVNTGGEAIPLGRGIPVDQARAYVFGYMIELATPVIDDYRSDLYRDAQALEFAITDQGGRFFWVARPTGTSFIAMDEPPNHIEAGGQAWRYYWFDVSCVDSKWELAITERVADR